MMPSSSNSSAKVITARYRSVNRHLGRPPWSSISRCRIWLIVSSVSILALKNAIFLQRRYFARSDLLNANGHHNAPPHQQILYDNVDDVLEVTECTPKQLSTILMQLPPDDCVKNQNRPWNQRCSLTYATQCPDATWLEDYYKELHNGAAHRHPGSHHFLSIFVGCNKGLDAVDAMRMGSGNPFFDKFAWADAMRDGNTTLDNDVCNQATSPQFPLKANGTGDPPALSFASSRVYCIEPMPITVEALQRAAHKLKYDRMGFVVTHAALSSEDGTVPFPRGTKVGVKNGGINPKSCNGKDQNCVDVATYSLDSYVSRFVPEGAPISYLSVDAEGYDHEVLLGGGGAVLARVRYLQFEYNWVGPWSDRSLRRAVDRLDREFGFTCYWAGFNNTLWRITRCWLEHYDLHFWSNVACVNREAREARRVADGMEMMFLDTLARGEENVRDFEHRSLRKDK